LHKPQVRSLAGKTFLVGETIPVDGITGDELFARTAQWGDMEAIRRMGESDSASIIGDIQAIGERLKKKRVSDEVGRTKRCIRPATRLVFHCSSNVTGFWRAAGLVPAG
jgi:hypothetical protein